MESSLVILVTGANRGLGLAIIRGLAEREPHAILCMGCRSRESGVQAAEELRRGGTKATLEVVELDVTQDDSIRSANQFLTERYKRIDVLINNAGIAGKPMADLSDFRAVYNSVLDTNVTSVAVITRWFLPLLLASGNPRVINVSSTRGSIALSASGKLPPTASIPYSVSKTALNILTLEIGKLYEDIQWYCVSPGHLRTAFNNYQGKKDPADGAKVVVELALDEKGQFDSGFWQFEDGTMARVPW